MNSGHMGTHRYRLLLGDCIEQLGNVERRSVDLVLTDPPYNLGLFMKGRATNLVKMRENYFGAAGWDNATSDEWVSLMDSFFAQLADTLKIGANVVIFMSVLKVETVVSLAENHGFYYKTTGTWHKTNPMPRNMNLQFVNSTESWIYFTYKTRTGTFNNDSRALHDYVESSVTPKSEKIHGKHPTQKPLAILNHFVKVLSSSGERVLDPFMGSGSTGVSAVSLRRSFVGIELDSEYFQIARNRIVEAGNEER